MAVPVVWVLVCGVLKSALASGFPQNGTLFMTAHNEYYTSAFTSSITGDPRQWRNRNVRFNDSSSTLDIYRAIDVQYRDSKLLFTSQVNRSIEARSLTTGIKYTVFHPISKNVKSIAVDWTTNQVYWGDPLYNWISMTTIGENQEGHFVVIVNTGLDNPYGVAVHPGKGYLFWTENGAVPKIERATLSGKKRTVLATRNVGSARTILLDYATDLLYWSSSNRVERMTMDGAGRELVYRSYYDNFMDIALYHELLFASSYSLTSSGHYTIEILNVVTKSYVRRLKVKSGAVPLGLVMFDSSRQPQFSSACANKGCKEFCVNDPDGAVCLCRHGKRLLEDGVSCSGYDRMHPPFFVYAHGWTICQLPKYFPDHDSTVSNNDCLIPVSSARDFGAVAFDVHAETIFTAEESGRVIYALKNNKISKTMSGFGSIHAMGADWINSKLYWVDTVLKHIKVSEESGHHQHVLLSNLDDPRGLAVDPVNRRLFWCGEKHRKWYIRVAYLDGSNVTDYVIADERPRFRVGIPTSLTVDYQDGRLYWSDSYLNKILSVPLHGKKYGGITHVYTDSSFLARIFDFTTFQDYVVWTDNSPFNRGVYAAIKHGRKLKRLTQRNGETHGIVMYDYAKQPLNGSSDDVNRCDINNGECEQLCLTKNTGRTCACGIGYSLSTDGVTCQTSSLSDKFVLISDSGTKTIYQLSLSDEHRLFALPFGKLGSPYAIDYDPVERRVYWSDYSSNPEVLKRASLDGSFVETLRTFTDTSVDDIKIDPISRLIYIAETSNNTISVLTLNGTQKKTLIISERPKRIEVDYVNGYLFWATDPSTNPRNPRIMRSYLDGTHQEVLVEHPHDIHSVRSLSLGPTRNVLYWVDLFFNKVERISLSGAAPYRSKIVVDYINHYDEENLNKIAVYSVAADGDHVYYSDHFNRSLWKVGRGDTSASSFSDSDDHEEEADMFGPPVFGTVTHIKIYNSSHHVDENNSCSQNNGRCSHHCLPTPVGATCACEDGIPLLSDGRTCNYPTGCIWSSWGSWSECSKSCGGGIQEKTRTCSSLTDSRTRKCNLETCVDPVDGRWSEWSYWLPCSRSCGGGSQYRSRVCIAPINGGAECAGSSIDVKTCNSNPCPVNGSWSVWSSWSFCNKPCGGGEKRRNRDCNNPAQQHGGAPCTGPSVNSTSCNTIPCPVDGQWSSWGGWSKCSVTCDYGHKARRRTCDGPYHGGNPCKGSSAETSQCKDADCQMDGVWSSWSNWTECSASCGSGQKQRGRVCTPPPRYSSKECQGSRTETAWCVIKECPVHGNWSNWTRWSSCSKTCGYGQKTRTRSCTQPQHGGEPCEGDAKQWSDCIVKMCPVNGDWSDWGQWSSCSVTCFNGTKSRHRACTNPEPRYGGTDCQGIHNETLPCFADCPIDGYWLPWSNWNSCSKSCGYGEKIRQRDCKEPMNGGSTCHGNKIDKKACLLKNCPVHGNWSQWSPWTDCSTSCGQGLKTRSRTCTQPTYRGQPCSGDSSEGVICSEVENCPIHGVWRPWSAWSGCSTTCGHGERRRRRACEGPYFGGSDCAGSYVDVRPCNNSECPRHARWSQWGQWSSCSVRCGNGSMERTRNCTDISPVHERKGCLGSNTDTMPCGNPCQPTAMWTEWEEWTPCSDECNGLRTRQRLCNNAVDGERCVGAPFETDTCKNCNVVGVNSKQNKDKQNENNDKRPQTNHVPTIVGGSVAGIVAIAIVLVVAFLWRKRMNLKSRERIARHLTGIPPPEYTVEPNYCNTGNISGGSSTLHDNKVFYMGLDDSKGIGALQDTEHVYETCIQNGNDNNRNEALYETLSHFRSGQNQGTGFHNLTYDTNIIPKKRPSVENVLGVGGRLHGHSGSNEHVSDIIDPPCKNA